MTEIKVDPNKKFTGGLKIVFVKPWSTVRDVNYAKKHSNLYPQSHASFEDKPLNWFVETALHEKGLCGRDFIIRDSDLAKGELIVEADLTPRRMDA